MTVGAGGKSHLKSVRLICPNSQGVLFLIILVLFLSQLSEFKV
jgi:hypothetical protein